jgi:hypothetical protein
MVAGNCASRSWAKPHIAHAYVLMFMPFSEPKTPITQFWFTWTWP